MRSKLLYSMMVLLPLVTYTACSSDDDSSQASAGSGGTAGAGHAGTGGGISEAGTASGGVAGEDALGGSGNGPNGAGLGGGGTGGAVNEAGAGGDAGSAGAAAAMLTDAEILKVLVTANQGEIAAGQVAVPSAHAVAVSNFAQMMITDHSNANAQALALVSTKHIAPAESDVSRKLENEGAALLVTLSQTPSASFDKVYITSQVDMHTEVLHLIDARLLPSASDGDLKALISMMRTSVAAHLQDATTILASL